MKKLMSNLKQKLFKSKVQEISINDQIELN